MLLEGEAGVGKTEAAKALAARSSARLIRLQCYEGLDVAHAVYEWNYPRQLLHIRAAQEGTVREDELFGPEFLIRRPLLEAIDSDEPVVLLIDEVDRADEEFEAFLLEVLSDFQITIPELGTITRARRPAVILTSNRTRELHDALKRRALFHWIGHPSIDREIEIVRLRVPGDPGAPRRRGGGLRPRAPRARPREAARRRRDDRLGDGLERARAEGARRGGRPADARLGPEVPRGHRGPPATRRCRGSSSRRADGDGGVGRMQSGDAIVSHVVTFGRVLREAGLEVGPGRVADALRASTRSISRARRTCTSRSARRSSRATMSSTSSIERSARGSSARRCFPGPNADRCRARQQGRRGAHRRRLRAVTRTSPSTATPLELGASGHELLRKKDFAELTGDELRRCASSSRGSPARAPTVSRRRTSTRAATGSTCGA